MLGKANLSDMAVQKLCNLGGILMYSLALDLFLVGHDIAAGGLSGIAVVLRQYLPLRVGTMVFIMNLPILAAAMFLNGWRYTLTTVVGTVLYSLVTDLLSFLPTLTTDPLAAALFGGVMYGVGMALLTVGNGSTGGTDLLMRLLVKRFPNFSQGKMSAIIDGSVIVLAMISFGNVEVGLYAIITLMVCSFVCDRILTGFKRGSLCIVVTSHPAHEVADPLMKALGRGVTDLNGTGMYSDTARSVLLVAMRPQELFKVKSIIQDLDRDAFVMMLGANELVGGNFHSHLLRTRRP